jgi:hypothetical protein
VRTGVPPCQVRTSRMSAQPAGAGAVTASFIQRGSSARAGTSSYELCVPLTKRCTEP